MRRLSFADSLGLALASLAPPPSFKLCDEDNVFYEIFRNLPPIQNLTAPADLPIPGGPICLPDSIDPTKPLDEIMRKFEAVAPGFTKALSADYGRGNQQFAAGLSLQDLSFLTDKLPDVLIFFRITKGEIPDRFTGHGKCMVHYADVQSDDHKIWATIKEPSGDWRSTRGSDSSVMGQPVVAVYAHDPGCDKDVHELLSIRKAELLKAIEAKKAEIERLQTCEKDKVTGEMICNSKKRLIEELDYLAEFAKKENEKDSAGKQVAKIDRYLEVLKDSEEHFDQQHTAMIRKIEDPDVPMVFTNQIGSCFIIVVLQVLFALPNIRDHIKSITEPEVKAAIAELANLKYDEHAAVATATKFRDALKDWTFCSGPLTYTPEPLKYVISQMPSLKEGSVAHFLDFHDGSKSGQSLKQYLSSSELLGRVFGRDSSTLFVSLNKREELPYLRDASPDLPLEVAVPNRNTGELRTFELIATLQAEFGHVASKVRVWSPSEKRHKWYYLTDYLAASEDEKSVVNKESFFFVYQLKSTSKSSSSAVNAAVFAPSPAAAHIVFSGPVHFSGPVTFGVSIAAGHTSEVNHNTLHVAPSVNNSLVGVGTLLRK